MEEEESNTKYNAFFLPIYAEIEEEIDYVELIGGRTQVCCDGIEDCFISVKCKKCEYRSFQICYPEEVARDERGMGFMVFHSDNCVTATCPTCHESEDDLEIELHAYPAECVQYEGDESFDSQKFELTYIHPNIFHFDQVMGANFRAYYYQWAKNLPITINYKDELIGKCFENKKNLKLLSEVIGILENIEQFPFLFSTSYGKEINLKILLQVKEMYGLEKDFLKHNLGRVIEKANSLIPDYDPRHHDYVDIDEKELYNVFEEGNKVYLNKELGELNTQYIKEKEAFIASHMKVLEMGKLKKAIMKDTSKSLQYNIFLSYFNEDSEIASKIKNKLENQVLFPELDIKVWIDKEKFLIGDPMTTIPHAIWHDTEGFIGLLSNDALSSRFVDDELNVAYAKYVLKKNWHFYPIIIGEIADDNLPSFVNSVRYTQFNDDSSFYDDLITNIRAKIKRENE